MKTVYEVFSDLQQAKAYVLSSDYAMVWEGASLGELNEYNQYIETISIPGRTIQTNDSFTANSLRAKIGQDITFDDFEITWRITGDFKIFKILERWMSQVKTVNTKQGGLITGVTTGFYDEYCMKNSCKIGTQTELSGSPTWICQIRGLYPVTMQSVQFSAEGGEYIKLTTTFSCHYVENLVK